MPDLVVQALALTISHLKQFGLERTLCLADSFRPFSNNVEMSLSTNAMQQLEVCHNFFISNSLITSISKYYLCISFCL